VVNAFTVLGASQNKNKDMGDETKKMKVERGQVEGK